MEPFESACPIDSRYYGSDEKFFARYKPYVSEESSVRYMAMVEHALVETLAEWKLCPPGVPDEVRRAIAGIAAREVYAEEARVGHNIRALVNCIRERVGEEAGTWVHLFATSADIMDTSNALRLKDLAYKALLPDLIALHGAVSRLARAHAATPQIGRTHGMFAEPITFGFAMALHVERLGGRVRAIKDAADGLCGMFSGAVGAHNALSVVVEDPMAFERSLLGRLGLQPSVTGVSSQIAQPEPVCDLAHAAVSCFSVLANVADDVRGLHRSEIGEVREGYSKDQVGSSTMPHKVNPKTFENVKSMWKEFMPRMVTVYMDQISEHQRDLTNSASSRFVFELMTAFAYAVCRLTSAVSGLEVDAARMKENLDRSKAEIVAEPLYVMLASKGHPSAYEYSRSLVKRYRSEGTPVLDLLKADPAAKPFLDSLSPDQVWVLEDPARYLGDAVARTAAACDHWDGVMDSIKSEIGA
jgi:adenylosuccinate lyase